MKAADLKKSILQYAVEGKLVPQDIHDEPASLLYDKIIKEKETLIKQGKIKKEKPLPPITDDEIPYDIPENWKWVRLGEVFIIERGASPRPISSFVTNDINGINWIKIGDAKKGCKYITNTKEKITQEGAKRSRFVNIGDFIFSNSMSFGRPYILKINGCIHDGWNVLKQITNQIDSIKINSDFIYYIISSSLLQSQIIQKAMGGIVENIKSDNLKTLLFPLPPLKEQERIVKKIDELMALCDKLEQEEEKLSALDKHFADTLPKSILQYAVEGKLIPQDIHDEPASILYDKIIKEKETLIKQGKIKKEKPLPPITDDEIPYDIPENWKWARLGEVCNLSIGKTPERKIAEYWKDGIYNWVAISDMINGGLINQTKEKISQIAYNKVFKKDILPIGTLLFSFKLTIGKVSLLNIPAYTNEAICAITPYLYDNIKYYLLKILPILNLLDNANDAIKGKTLNLQTLPLILIPLPPLKEQERIVKKIDELLTYCNKLKDII